MDHSLSIAVMVFAAACNIMVSPPDLVDCQKILLSIFAWPCKARGIGLPQLSMLLLDAATRAVNQSLRQ